MSDKLACLYIAENVKPIILNKQVIPSDIILNVCRFSPASKKIWKLNAARPDIETSAEEIPNNGLSESSSYLPRGNDRDTGPS